MIHLKAFFLKYTNLLMNMILILILTDSQHDNGFDSTDEDYQGIRVSRLRSSSSVSCDSYDSNYERNNPRFSTTYHIMLVWTIFLIAGGHVWRGFADQFLAHLIYGDYSASRSERSPLQLLLRDLGLVSGDIVSCIWAFTFLKNAYQNVELVPELHEHRPSFKKHFLYFLGFSVLQQVVVTVCLELTGTAGFT